MRIVSLISLKGEGGKKKAYKAIWNGSQLVSYLWFERGKKKSRVVLWPLDLIELQLHLARVDKFDLKN